LTDAIQISRADLALILEALEEAAFFHDARSRVVDTAARRSRRKFTSRLPEPSAQQDAGGRKTLEYVALAAKLRAL
jgi:hypothetical protein